MYPIEKLGILNLASNIRIVCLLDLAILRLHRSYVIVIRRRQRNLQRFITHVHSYCFAFGDVLVVVVVVVNLVLGQLCFVHG